jgi:hypothetical protein
MTTESIRLDSVLISKAKIIGGALSRSPAKQIEHWAKIGRIMEDNPELPYEFVKNAAIAKAKKETDKLENYIFD